MSVGNDIKSVRPDFMLAKGSLGFAAALSGISAVALPIVKGLGWTLFGAVIGFAWPVTLMVTGLFIMTLIISFVAFKALDKGKLDGDKDREVLDGGMEISVVGPFSALELEAVALDPNSVNEEEISNFEMIPDSKDLSKSVRDQLEAKMPSEMVQEIFDCFQNDEEFQRLLRAGKADELEQYILGPIDETLIDFAPKKDDASKRRSEEKKPAPSQDQEGILSSWEESWNLLTPIVQRGIELAAPALVATAASVALVGMGVGAAYEELSRPKQMLQEFVEYLAEEHEIGSKEIAVVLEYVAKDPLIRDEFSKKNWVEVYQKAKKAEALDQLRADLEKRPFTKEEIEDMMQWAKTARWFDQAISFEDREDAFVKIVQAILKGRARNAELDRREKLVIAGLEERLKGFCSDYRDHVLAEIRNPQFERELEKLTSGEDVSKLVERMIRSTAGRFIQREVQKKRPNEDLFWASPAVTKAWETLEQNEQFLDFLAKGQWPTAAEAVFQLTERLEKSLPPAAIPQREFEEFDPYFEDEEPKQGPPMIPSLRSVDDYDFNAQVKETRSAARIFIQEEMERRKLDEKYVIRAWESLESQDEFRRLLVEKNSQQAAQRVLLWASELQSIAESSEKGKEEAI